MILCWFQVKEPNIVERCKGSILCMLLYSNCVEVEWAAHKNDNNGMTSVVISFMYLLFLANNRYLLHGVVADKTMTLLHQIAPSLSQVLSM